MADRFIIHGAAFNGDGTTSSEATSNGGVGAWNTLTYFEGTTPAYGALPAGTTVYIRPKDAAGADITVSYAGGATYFFGSSSAITSNWITWVVDNGEVWPGVDGIIKFTITSTSFTYSFRNYNRIVCRTKHSLVFECLGDGSAWSVAWLVAGDLQGVLFRMPNKVGTGSGDLMLNNATLSECTIDYGRFHQNGIIGVGSASYNVVCNLTVNALYPTPASSVVFGKANLADIDSAQLILIGGELRGVGATTGLSLANLTSRGRTFEFVGFKFPNTVAPVYGTTHAGNRLSIFGADGSSGSVLAEIWGYVDSRQDGYYPTLNAAYPGSDAQPWSYKMYPVNVSRTIPARVVVSTLITGSASQKTITLNVLVADSMVGVNKESTYITVTYIDNTTGTAVFLTTRSTPLALDTSEAAWSSTTYGPISFLKYEIAVTTPTAVKQDTLITVAFITYAKAASVNDIMFIDPALVLS